MSPLSRVHLRRVARWLIATLLFSALHPAFASGMAAAPGMGGMVQICTGAGMAWVRIVDHTAQPAAAAPAQDSAQDSQPAGGETAAAASPCPFCLGAALAPAGSCGDVLAFDWLPQAPAAPPSAPPCAPLCARLMLDAPTRGPPQASLSA